VGGTILGNPEGKTYTIWYDTKLCMECGMIYYVLQGDTHGITIKPTQNINEPKSKIFIPNISVIVNEEYCPKCGIALQQGYEILKQVINRDKCWKFQLEPIESEENALICPYCKQDYLSYHNFWLAD
jgi:hypothetical protein